MVSSLWQEIKNLKKSRKMSLALQMIAHARFALCVFYLLASSLLASCGLMIMGLITLPLGLRTAKLAMCRCLRIWVLGLAALTHLACPSQLFITVDPDSPSSEIIHHIIRIFNINADFSLNKLDPMKESGLIIANHQLYSDWIYLFIFLSHLNRGQYLKFVLRRDIQFMPLIGLAMKLLGFIFIHRNWALDEAKFRRRIGRLETDNVPYNLIIFPEGTTLNPSAKVKCSKYAKEHDLPQLDHVLLPRSTGLLAALESLESSDSKGILDLTMGYTEMPPDVIPEGYFTLKGLFGFGHGPPQVHIHCSYVPINKIPFDDRESFTRWLADRFSTKDIMLKKFFKEGCFDGHSANVPTRLYPDGSFVSFWVQISIMVFIPCFLIFYL